MKLLIKKKKNCKKIFKKKVSQKDFINNEYRKSVDIIKKYKESKKYEDNLETMKKIKGLEEDLESSYKSIDVFTNIYTDNLEKI